MMEWVKVSTGIAPVSPIILVLTEDITVILAKKGDADNVFGFRYFDRDGNDVMKDSKPVFFMNIWLPI